MLTTWLWNDVVPRGELSIVFEYEFDSDVEVVGVFRVVFSMVFHMDFNGFEWFLHGFHKVLADSEMALKDFG